ncbi:MAG TPA: hypothetical protein PL124_02060 [Candidatus Cloacimonadota bacterium]|nr:hypothetical protein [Candidatus Cloacimonadota bacterium]HPS38178.1 hypothetical protein [Candidatus Cloacimonadota bacterium]
MIPLNSPIQQSQFVVLEASVKLFVPDNTTEIDTSKSPIDLDYDIYQSLETPHKLRIILTIRGNMNEEVPGYVLLLKTGSEFDISPDLAPSSQEFQDFVKRAALPCVINEARAYLQSMTIFLPFGKFTLPMLDINDLLQQKNEQLKQSPPVEASESKPD